MHFCFEWRPITYRKYVIANTLGKELNDILVKIVEVLFWIFCALPFASAILWGIMTAIEVKPVILGVDIAVAPCAIMLLVIGFMNYNKNGYKLTKSVMSFLGISAFLLVGLTICDVIMMEETSWMSGAYLIVFPGLLFFGFWECFNRSKIPHDKTMSIMQSEEESKKFVKDIIEGTKDDWIIGGDYSSFNRRLFGAALAIIVSAICSGLFHKYFVDYGATKAATVATSVGSFFVDFAAIVTLMTSMTKVNSISFMFLVLVIKDIAITFSSRFWLAGHAVIIAIIGSFYFYRISYFILTKIFKETTEFPGKESLDENVRESIDQMKTDANNISMKEIVTSIILFIIFFIAAIVEIATTDNFILEPVCYDEMYTISQKDVMVVCITLTFASSIIFAVYLLNQNKELSLAYSAISFCCIILVWMVCFFGADLRAFDVRYYISCIYTIIAMLLIGNTKKILIGFPYTPIYIIAAGAAIVLIVMPIVSRTGLFGGFVVSIITTCFSFYMIIIQNVQEYRKYWLIGGGTSVCAFIVFSIFAFSSFFTGIGFFVGALWILVLIWRINILIKKEFEITFTDLLFFLIPGAIVAIAGACLFTASKMAGCIVLFFGVAVSFISAAFYLRKSNKLLMKIIIAVGVVIEIGDFMLFIFVAKSYYIGLSVICGICFIFGLGYVIASVTKGGKADTAVYSEIFFPIRRLKKGEMMSMSVLGFALALSFIAPWIWGVFSGVFFVYPWFGILGQASAFSIILFLIFGLLTDFDNSAIQSLEIITKDGLEYAVKQATKSVNATIIDENAKEEFQIETYEQFLHYVEAKTNSAATKSMFSSSLRGQLKITGDVEFGSVVTSIKSYMKSKGAEWDYIKDQSYYTYSQRGELIKVYKEIEKLNAPQKAEIVKYDNYVQDQEDNRIVKQQKVISEIIENESKSVSKSKTKSKSKEYQAIIDEYADTSKKYTDPNFYPSQTFGEDNELIEDSKWERAENLLTGEFLGNTSPNDLCQGSIGDCYLISALAAISSNMNLVKKIFETPVLVKNGVYCVNFKIFNKQVPVVVDSNILTSRSRCKFVKPRDKAKSPWWFTIVEKAYAKLNGSFSAIEGGQVHKALDFFVDGLPDRCSFDTPEGKELIANGELFNMLLRFNQNGSFIGAGSSSGSDTDKNDKGIVLGHAYSIHKVVRTHGFELLQMRNPWGDSEWTGDWSDNSPMWDIYPEVARELGREDADDGMFWISFNDFVENYRVVYYLDTTKDMKHIILNGHLHSGEFDGANGCSSTAPDLTHVQNYVLRFTKPTKLSMKLERSGVKTDVKLYMMYNNGDPIVRLYCGYKTFQGTCPDFTTFDTFSFNINDYEKPWTLAVSRKESSEPTEFNLHFYCEDDFEVEALSMDGTFPPHKIFEVNDNNIDIPDINNFDFDEPDDPINNNNNNSVVSDDPNNGNGASDDPNNNNNNNFVIPGVTNNENGASDDPNNENDASGDLDDGYDEYDGLDDEYDASLGPNNGGNPSISPEDEYDACDDYEYEI
jgi:hypothetical protein